jgi:hypothetical protein
MVLCDISINNYTIPSKQINELPIYIVPNVRNIEYNQIRNQTSFFSDLFGYNVNYDDSPQTLDEDIAVPIFFYFDGIYSDAFGHWIFESAVALAIWKGLKKIYPSLKIYTCIKRSYKDCVYKGFDIIEDDIVYELPKGANRVVFTSYMTFFDHTMDHTKKYDVFCNGFHKALTESRDVQKNTSILYLPRGNLENYKGNDRIIQNQQEIENLVRSYPNSKIYHTDQTKDIRDQIDIVRQAKIVICDYGSNFTFNSFFCENSTIITLGEDKAHTLFAMGRIIYQSMLERNNKLVFLPREESSYDGTLKYRFSINRIKKAIDDTIH